jgi:hypothetical protein
MGGLEILKVLKELYEGGHAAMTLATVAVVAVAYIHWIESPAVTDRVTGVERQVTSIREGQLETKLDQTFAALCQNPGDPALLERIRDLQQQYMEVTQHRYPQPSCDLLLKIK